MSEIKRPRASLICDSAREDFLRTKLDLRSSSEYEWIDATQCKTLADFKARHIPINTTVYIDSHLISESKIIFEDDWKFWNIVVICEKFKDTQFGNWRGKSSVLNISRLEGPALLSAVAVSLAQENYPGIFIFLEQNTEIFYEKIQSLHEIGSKVDRFTALLEKIHPNLISQFFNLRQLSYSLLHEGLLASTAKNKLNPLVDFQIAADKEKIAFAVRFNAAPGTSNSWQQSMGDGSSQRWMNARMSTELLVFTELDALSQCEVKGVIARSGDYSNGESGSFLFAHARKFQLDSRSIEKQKAVKFSLLRDTPAVVPTKGVQAINPMEVQEKGEQGDEQSPSLGVDLNYKLKADMLANEKEDLQALLKKKTLLISGLTKDINKAQSQVGEAQKDAAKELMKMRMEVEREKNIAKAATKKLMQIQKKLEEEKKAEDDATKAAAAGGEARNFEAEYKITVKAKELAEQKLVDAGGRMSTVEGIMQRQKKEIGELTAQKNELKAKIRELEQEVAKNAHEQNVKAAMMAREAEPTEAAAPDRYLEMTKKFTEAKTAKEEAEKEQKRLQIKLETAEKNLVAQAAHSKKHQEGIEKSLEEAKKQKTEAAKKLDEMKLEMKKKIEEMNLSERALKKKTDETAVALKAKTTELERFTKKINLTKKVS